MTYRMRAIVIASAVMAAPSATLGAQGTRATTINDLLGFAWVKKYL